MGFVKSHAELKLYILNRNRFFVFLVVHIYDIVLLSDEQAGVNAVIKEFNIEFDIRVSKKVERYLGILVEDSGKEMRLRNKPMIKKILECFEMSDYKHTAPLNIGRFRIIDSRRK